MPSRRNEIEMTDGEVLAFLAEQQVAYDERRGGLADEIRDHRKLGGVY